MNRFRLLSVLSSDNVSWFCVPPVLFDRALSKPVLSDPGILVAAGVHFDVYRFYIREVTQSRSALVSVK